MGDSENRDKLRVLQSFEKMETHIPFCEGEVLVAVSAAHAAVRARISPRELLDWYYGDVSPERAIVIENVINSRSIKTLLWVSGYFDKSSNPLPESHMQILDHNRNTWPDSGSFIDEFKAEVVKRLGGKNGPGRVIGSWPGYRGRSRS